MTPLSNRSNTQKRTGESHYVCMHIIESTEGFLFVMKIGTVEIKRHSSFFQKTSDVKTDWLYSNGTLSSLECDQS